MSREQAIMELIPMARGMAGRFVARNGRMKFSEALSAATLGIIEAVDTKNDSGVPLEAWACMKARWQIGMDFRSQYAPRRKTRTEYISIEEINPANVVVEKLKERDSEIREEIDAAIARISKNYKATAREYFYGPTRNIVEISKRTGVPLMTCKRAIHAVRRELRNRLEAA